MIPWGGELRRTRIAQDARGGHGPRVAFVGNTEFETWLETCKSYVRAGGRPCVRADFIQCDFINDDFVRRYCGIDFTKAIEAIRGQIVQAGEDVGDPVMAECWEMNE